MTLFAGQIPTALELNEGPSSYVPPLTAVTTNPVLGTGGTQVGHFYRIGHLVVGAATFRFGSAGASFGSGAFIVGLPVVADLTLQRANAGSGLSTVVGPVHMRDNSPLQSWLGVAYLFSDQSLAMAGSDGANVDFNSPFTWDLNDGFTVQFSYLAQF